MKVSLCSKARNSKITKVSIDQYGAVGEEIFGEMSCGIAEAARTEFGVGTF